ncbi:MAG: UPF0149 family protein [Xanthomonadales bacterium]
MQTPTELDLPLDDFEYDELESFLLDLESDAAVFNISEFDGFVTALISGPEPIPPEEWMPVIWGGGRRPPKWKKPGGFARIAELMLRHFNTTAAMLQNDPQQFEPWYMENEVNGRVFPVVDDWCIGYMKAVMLRPEAWRVDEPEMVERLAQISLFSTPDCWDFLEQLADRHVEYLQNEIAPVARALYEFWLQQKRACTLPEGVSVH